MDVIVAILKILGSLGVFLYGMKVMSEGIQRTAGERMRKVMATMTHNRFAGVGTGLVTTGLLQSSSATTVMVVSFVNAGLLTLVESIGIIMGANLGTTLTAWIIAWVGKISIAEIALPIIGVGLPVFFVGKGKVRSMGEALIGFGLLFYGLGLLKDSVPDLKSMVEAGKDTAEYATAENVKAFISGLSGHGYGSLLIFLFIGTGMLAHRTPLCFVIAMKRACSNVSGIVFQYPFYAGIMGIMMFSGLGTQLASTIAAGASLETLPFLSQFAGALANFAIPSAGGEWAVIGPALTSAAVNLAADLPPDQQTAFIARVAMAAAYGETSSNLMQPFFLLLVLPVMGAGVRIQARDVMGYLVIPFLYFFLTTALLVSFVSL